MTNRRRILEVAAIGFGMAALAPMRRAFAEAAPDALTKALDKSEVLYMTPIKSNGQESKCHAEVWFAHVNGAIYVCSEATTWRARAVQKGLTKARVWVGDYGPWKKANDAFKKAPTADVTASLVMAADKQAPVLDAMGDKYKASWLRWGPEFRDGLKSGKRVLIEYRMVG